MNAEVLVFYAGLLYAECSHEELGPLRITWSQEIYNGAWVYVARQGKSKRYSTTVGWYRIDRTPVLIQDVPKQLRTLQLLLQ